MVARDAAPTHKVGPFDVSNNTDELVLRLEKSGELSVAGCMTFISTMMAVFVLGIMSILHTHETTPYGMSLDDPAYVFSPSKNHFGFLWLVGCIGVMIAMPLYVIHTYDSALIYRFRRSDDAFFRGKKRIARLRRIEYVSIRETRDPDSRYLYLLHIVYNDGQQMLIHNGYDEREIMNLANEISSFVRCPVKWKENGR